MDGVKRFAVLLVSGLSGAAAAVGYGWLTWSKAQDSAKGLSKSDAEWVKMASVFEVCVVFFAATYFIGRGIARAIGARDLQDEIRENSRWHLRLLTILSALFGIQRGWIANRRGGTQWDDWVAIAVGLGFAAVAVAFEIGRLRQARETNP
jgi:hypothetical protein